MSPDRMVIAERFQAGVDNLCEVVLPLDVVGAHAGGRLRILIAGESRALGHRVLTLPPAALDARGAARLVFPAFAAPAASFFELGVFAVPERKAAPVDADLAALRAAVQGRSPIRLACHGAQTADGRTDLLLDEQGMAVLPFAGQGAAGIHVAHGLDAFWCDAHGIYLQGWLHAHEHRVIRLRLESSGRAVTVAQFRDRPDLLAHYPEHEHVRHAGFSAYLACPAGHPVRATLETAGGTISFPLELPEHALPVWPKTPPNDSDTSPLCRQFSELANERGGRVLLIGARTADEEGGVAALSRRRLRGPVVGLDIHPGPSVQVVGDAHVLSRFVRERSFCAVASGAVLEHLAAPWLVAAEINRVLEPGGIVYHQAPQAWPAHAQPNDFWRFTSEGLRALFGPETGFEVLGAEDGLTAAMMPSLDWRGRHLEMPTVPLFASSEIVARKIRDLELGAVAWPLDARSSAARARSYPVAGVSLPPPKAEGAS